MNTVGIGMSVQSEEWGVTETEATLSHVGGGGEVRMVNVGDKEVTIRTARAEAVVSLLPAVAEALKTSGAVAKGNVIETARIAGIMAAKRTSELIPMCHPLPMDVARIEIDLGETSLRIESFVQCRARTGVEMEALTAVSVAALTVYDMCKSAGKGMTIGSIRLLEKSGGKSGDWTADGKDVT